VVFWVPGIGAQGGDLDSILAADSTPTAAECSSVPRAGVIIFAGGGTRDAIRDRGVQEFARGINSGRRVLRAR